MILLDEFVAAMTTVSGESVWGAFSQQAAEDLFREIDVTRTGKVTKAKFGHFVSVKTVESVLLAFKGADQDGNRQLTGYEFGQFARKHGISRKRSDDLWEKLDYNGNGKLSFKEFRDFAVERMAPETIQVSVRRKVSPPTPAPLRHVPLPLPTTTTPLSTPPITNHMHHVPHHVHTSWVAPAHLA